MSKTLSREEAWELAFKFRTLANRRHGVLLLLFAAREDERPVGDFYREFLGVSQNAISTTLEAFQDAGWLHMNSATGVTVDRVAVLRTVQLLERLLCRSLQEAPAVSVDLLQAELEPLAWETHVLLREHETAAGAGIRPGEFGQVTAFLNELLHPGTVLLATHSDDAPSVEAAARALMARLVNLA